MMNLTTPELITILGFIWLIPSLAVVWWVLQKKDDW
jgi:hypothetical protein